MAKSFLRSLLLIAATAGCLSFDSISTDPSNAAPAGPGPDNAGLKLPSGFTAIKVADSLGKARHLVVTTQHDIYVKLARPKNGKGILVLHENASGKAQLTSGIGDYGGTGIAIRNGLFVCFFQPGGFSLQAE